MKRGRPFLVDRRSAGVSIGCGQLANWSTPTLALPLLHAFTANFISRMSVPCWRFRLVNVTVSGAEAADHMN